MVDTVTPNVSQSDIATIEEAAARLGKSKRTIQRMVSAGKLGTVDIGGVNYIQLAGIDSDNDTTTATATRVITVDKRRDKVSQSDIELRERLEQQLRDTIRRLEDDNARLWTMVNSMLPAPNNSTQPRIPIWVWITLTAVLAAVATGVIIWLTR